ncbi:hypothetical protein [Methylobacterium planeticum]|uniref:Uncharacterized protein n=1 Tax=Methylobacterium planeticum TaxID=2615211 RepID=A0A6N6MJ09_9HYPH|nr:hypothetical protein [Methylobacterium planeticum]KAB1069940.1 hypothetical protein F6X51_24180 [Methylobacterium planeticum]
MDAQYRCLSLVLIHESQYARIELETAIRHSRNLIIQVRELLLDIREPPQRRAKRLKASAYRVG